MKCLLAGLCWEHWWSARDTATAITCVSLSWSEWSQFIRSINVNPVRRDPGLTPPPPPPNHTQTPLWSFCPVLVFQQSTENTHRNSPISSFIIEFVETKATCCEFVYSWLCVVKISQCWGVQKGDTSDFLVFIYFFLRHPHTLIGFFYKLHSTALNYLSY